MIELNHIVRVEPELRAKGIVPPSVSIVRHPRGSVNRGSLEMAIPGDRKLIRGVHPCAR